MSTFSSRSVVWIIFSQLTWHTLVRGQEYRTVAPQDNQELRQALCGNIQNGECQDKSFVKVIISKTFDFTNEEVREARGCWHKSADGCRERGQKRLDEVGLCAGRVPVDRVRYSQVGRDGLLVGSNRQILGVNDNSGIRGAGLRLRNVDNILIKGIRLTDINDDLVCGGDGINIHNSRGVIINGNYFKNIGHHMIVTTGRNGHIIIKRNVFDGETQFSAFCDGTHYWLWMFSGEDDHITLAWNDINSVSGRAPFVGGLPGSHALVHVLQNTFYDIKHPLVYSESQDAKIFMESNAFYHVDKIVGNGFGQVFFATNHNANQCRAVFGRVCYPNQGSGGQFDHGDHFQDSGIARDAMTNWQEGKRFGPNSKPTRDPDNIRPDWRPIPPYVWQEMSKM